MYIHQFIVSITPSSYFYTNIYDKLILFNDDRSYILKHNYITQYLK